MINQPLSRRQFGYLSLAVAAGWTLSLTSCAAGSEHRKIQLKHQRTDELYTELPITSETMITHSWIHSIEGTRWTDTYEVTNDGLLLTSTAFRTYGAGMPLNDGTLHHEDGQVVLKDLNRPFDAIRWIHSTRVDYRIGIDGDESLMDMDELPDQEPVELRPT